MPIIDNWKHVLFRTYSVWSMYLGLLCLVLPNVLYGVWQIETDPYPTGWAALVFFIAGIVGRVIDQKRSGRLARLIFLASFGFGALMLGLSIGGGIAEDFYLPEDSAAAVSADEQAFLIIPAMSEAPDAVPVALGIASNSEFLAVAVPYVGKWEGLRLVAYRDIVGVWTVCYGETKGVRPGDRYTKPECDAMLARELINYRSRLHRYFSPDTLAGRLPVYRDTAYTSLAYNVGVSGAGKSTAVRRLNAGNIPGGCQAITWWNKAGHLVVRGLTLRRGEDYGLCMIGVA
ncbi:lysozyme [Sulfitobacter pontiacus]|uniref:lysozyme n=1 Tax=Sulfitobacter pontiacus TaxID=60137 RepID=UPI00275111B6|nr:lysozyme [Sulfitobacter pontiacus]GLO78481.1 hypothetical protein MACH23_19020 [Sulfitobacter pontiacus]